MSIYASRFDQTGLVPAACGHGIQHHPDPLIDADSALRRHLGGTLADGTTVGTWIRSRYLDTEGRCPLDRGEPAPADMLVPR